MMFGPRTSKLTGLARPNVGQIPVGDADVDEQRRLPSGPHFAQRGGWIEQQHQRPRLRQPVSLEEKDAAVLKRPDESLGHRSPTGHDEPGARKICRRPKWGADQGVQKVRIPKAHRDLVFLAQTQDFVGIEGRGNDHRASFEQDWQHVHPGAADTKERSDGNGYVIAAKVGTR